MVRYSNAKGLVFRLKEEYPVYDENENIVGHTDVNDIAVVLYDAGEQDSYFEAVLATGTCGVRWACLKSFRPEKGPGDCLCSHS